MSELRCICTLATDEQWLFVKIVIWFGIAVIVCVFGTLIIWKIQDCLERRHLTRRRAHRHHGRDRRNQPDEGRFEEIRD